MVGLARYVSAVLVAVALVAAQMMPSWAGCHAQRQAGLAITDAVKVVATDIAAPGHHGMSHAVDITSDTSVMADRTQPLQKDICLGQCGCACGIGSAVLLAPATAIDAPHGVMLTPEFASHELPLGDRPDGPRRPPRTTA